MNREHHPSSLEHYLHRKYIYNAGPLNAAVLSQDFPPRFYSDQMNCQRFIQLVLGEAYKVKLTTDQAFSRESFMGAGVVIARAPNLSERLGQARLFDVIYSERLQDTQKYPDDSTPIEKLHVALFLGKPTDPLVRDYFPSVGRFAPDTVLIAHTAYHLTESRIEPFIRLYQQYRVIGIKRLFERLPE